MTPIQRLFLQLEQLESHGCAALSALSEAIYGGVAHPINDFSNLNVLVEELLYPLVTSLPDLERRPLIAIQSEFNNALWEMGTGFWIGTFSQPLLGIPATQSLVAIRYTEMIRYQGDQIIEWYVLPDWLDLMLQANVYPLRPSLGDSGRVLPPNSLDGMYPQEAPESSAKTQSLVMAMLDELGRYDGRSLESMDLARFWHADFNWYGPAGIGTTRGIEGFRRNHQGPFLKAFPNRVVDHHQATVARGQYAGTGGWPHMHGTHSGGGWLGLPPTQARLALRVMDIWRREGGLLRENWVAIDIGHMLHQMGLDVFAQMRQLTIKKH